MVIDPRLFIHDADRITLDALKAIPGFTQFLKAFMKVWNEKQYAVLNMSSNIKLSEEQLPKYYNMLPPICEKLGIEVPELYLTLDDMPNAYTSGDTKPFIVITSGLIEKLPDDLIPTVLAHECGHIACHHVLYHTMGQMILNGGALGLTLITGMDFSAILSAPLSAAFAKWLRCSELSADRVAAVCDGTPDNIVKMCMFFAGYNKILGVEANVDAFFKQAEEYKQMVDGDRWNKILENMMFRTMSHPLSAVRALECHEWAKSDDFRNAVDYSSCSLLEEYKGSIPLLDNSSHYLFRNKEEAAEMFRKLGFTDISFNRVVSTEKKAGVGEVLDLTIGDSQGFKKGEWFPVNSPIVLNYYEPKSEEEIAAEHPDERRLPEGYKYYIGMHFQGVKYEFENAGFTNIVIDKVYIDNPGRNFKEGNTLKVFVNGNENFEKGIWTDINAEIRIGYASAQK